jgi:hypothetical protein
MLIPPWWCWIYSLFPHCSLLTLHNYLHSSNNFQIIFPASDCLPSPYHLESFNQGGISGTEIWLHCSYSIPPVVFKIRSSLLQPTSLGISPFSEEGRISWWHSLKGRVTRLLINSGQGPVMLNILK